MTRADVIRFRLLGPLEIDAAGDVLPLAGAKQRTVLAALLLKAGEVVSTERLVDELWGETPPSSATHSLEVYVSRLRQLLNGHGPSLIRSGSGYMLDLADAELDSRTFTALADRVDDAWAAGDSGLTIERADEALAPWRGRALSDVPLGPIGRAEADRLEERRLHTIELRIDACLALGRHEAIVGELQALVAEYPYRERFVSQLMLALYRSGRQAEALDAYEHTRRRLDDDLGLQPSAELQQLSGRIVRQESGLAAPAGLRPAEDEPRRTRDRAGRLAGLVAAGVAAAAVVTLSAAGGAADSSVAPSAPRVALVLQRESPVTAYTPSRNRWLTDGLNALAEQGAETQLVEISAIGSRSSAERTANRLDGQFDLVLFAVDEPSASTLASLVAPLRDTRWVFLDTSVRTIGAESAANVSAVRFASEQTHFLAGALAGRMPPTGGEPRQRPDVVGIVAGRPTSETKRAVTAFTRGVEHVLPGAVVRVEYTRQTLEPTACELTANRQISAGADVVLVHAGECGSGALAVIRARGVWAIASDGVGRAGDHIIGSLFEDWDNAMLETFAAFQADTLPSGGDMTLGLDGYHVGLEMKASLPSDVASEVVEICSDLRRRTHSFSAVRHELP